MLPVLYEDDNIIAIDKPAGIASIPERDLAKETVLSLLEKQLKQKPFIVHRLDKEVSGVMLFAKNAGMHKYLNEEFFNRNVHKTYRALVHGIMKEEKGEIAAPLRQFGSGRMGVDEKRGKPSRTKYEVIKKIDKFTITINPPISCGGINFSSLTSKARESPKIASLSRLHILPVQVHKCRDFGVCSTTSVTPESQDVADSCPQRFTLINAYPVTGRRHQIRVHLYSIGHPIVGDTLYGDRNLQKKYPRHTRLMLHSERIAFTLPDGKEVEIKSKVPEPGLSRGLSGE